MTRWRREFRSWQAHQARWSFRCDPAFRRGLKKNYPETYARLAAEDHFFVGLSCAERLQAPVRPGP